MKKTTVFVLASAFTLSMSFSTVKANPISNALSSAFSALATPSMEVRGFRGGFSRSSGFFNRGSGSSSRALTVNPRNSSSGAKSNSSNSSANTASKDADFNSTSAGRSNSNYGANFGGQGRAGAAAYQGGGSPFLSSMMGSMTGMMLYSMLFPTQAHAGTMQNGQQVTPESISDADLENCLSELSVQKEKLESLKTKRLGSGDATDEEMAQIDADLKKLTDLELTLVKEQVRRLKEAS
ncbi:hypothetical protein [Succinatimonas hippei]|uniref:hypothetical protein n=1 Tax=Succinatimonas hippei TaxID=626938 RepID=UPI00255CE941|nr:hypothetical protein [Succinatimonas hippei]MDM8119912.1 hypothetical protein [Succinatimonas hippei]